MVKDERGDAGLRLIEKVQSELMLIESTCPSYDVRERIHKLLELIDEETTSNKKVLIDLVYDKVKQTKVSQPELNADFYLLYRNLVENRISIPEGKLLYEMYKKELNNPL